MGLSSCSIKFLKTAYIGATVRLTGGKDTEKFDNKPMKDIKIEKFSSDGIRFNHPSMPKPAWVHFYQLPLLDLTIINGVIKDEITFVENILNRCTEFIKTDSDEYTSAVAENNIDSKLSLVGPLKLSLGDKVISAQCKEGIEMVFLGNFFLETIIKEYPKKPGFHNHGHTRDYEAQPTIFIHSDPPLRRAIFLRKIDIDKICINTSYIPSNVKDFFSKYFKVDLKRSYYPYGEEKIKRDKIYATINEDINQAYRDKGYEYLYQIIEYPITNKYVKELMVIGRDDEHTSINKNRSIINTNYNLVPITNRLELTKYVVGHYGSKDRVVHQTKKEVREFAENYIKDLYEMVKSKRSST